MASVALSQPGPGPGMPADLGIVARLRSAMLRVPLLWKLLGANVLLIAAMGIAHGLLPATPAAVEIVLLLLLIFGATGSLVWLALRPVAALEQTAERVSRGDFAARAPMLQIADRDMLGLAHTINRLLDRVEADRARINYLAGRSVRARDIERESVARELRDSFAQTLAAIGMQLALAEHASADQAAAEPIAQSRAMIQDLTEEMRSVAETLYPGTLAEFGLVNAIEALARRVSRRSELTVDVDAGVPTGVISPRAASALYRVADEALRNIENHAQARNVRISLSYNGQLTLEIEDDGRGIDMKQSDPLHAGLGLFSAKAVLALSGGELQVSSGPGLGTRVTARVPLEHNAAPRNGNDQ